VCDPLEELLRPDAETAIRGVPREMLAKLLDSR